MYILALVQMRALPDSLAEKFACCDVDIFRDRDGGKVLCVVFAHGNALMRTIICSARVHRASVCVCELCGVIS